jgi:ABC-type ATPase involved in cell division
MNNNKPEFLFFYGPSYSGKSCIIRTLLEGKADGIFVRDGTILNKPFFRSIKALIGEREFII